MVGIYKLQQRVEGWSGRGAELTCTAVASCAGVAASFDTYASCGMSTFRARPGVTCTRAAVTGIQPGRKASAPELGVPTSMPPGHGDPTVGAAATARVTLPWGFKRYTPFRQPPPHITPVLPSHGALHSCSGASPYISYSLLLPPHTQWSKHESITNIVHIVLVVAATLYALVQA